MPTDSSDDTKRDEAIKFNTAMLENKAMLVAFARLLAKPYNTPDEMKKAVDDFITDKSKNGVASFATDYDTVLKVQQTMQVYDLIYWNGFYKTTIVGDKGAKDEKGPELVIAATLDPAAPYHVGLGRTQIIDPTFKALTLSWDEKDGGVQDTSGKLIFNLVPTTSGATTRTLSGTWTDSDGATKILIGTETPDGETSDDKKKQEDEQKKLLPPGLVEILPLITALGTVVAMAGGVAAMLWIGKQWREKNLERAAKEAEARAKADDEQAQEDAEVAARADQEAQRAQGRVGGQMENDADEVENLDEEGLDLLRNRVNRAPMPPPEIVQDDLEALRQELEGTDWDLLADKLAEMAPPDPVVSQEGEGSGADNLLLDIESESEGD
jgi:hypothetical protein